MVSFKGSKCLSEFAGISLRVTGDPARVFFFNGVPSVIVSMVG